MGLGIGFIISKFFIADEEIDPETFKTKVFWSLLPQAGLSLVLSLLTLFTFKKKPKTPPSKIATYPRDDDILGCFRELVMDPQYVKL